MICIRDSLASRRQSIIVPSGRRSRSIDGNLADAQGYSKRAAFFRSLGDLDTGRPNLRRLIDDIGPRHYYSLAL
jgi:hypothetical protein